VFDRHNFNLHLPRCLPPREPRAKITIREFDDYSTTIFLRVSDIFGGLFLALHIHYELAGSGDWCGIIFTAWEKLHHDRSGAVAARRRKIYSVP